MGAALGFRRVSWVRIVVGRSGVRCEVAGVVHRRPVVRPVPLRSALALSLAGVPTVVRRPDPAVAAGGPARVGAGS